MKNSHSKNGKNNVLKILFCVVFICGYFFSCSKDVKVDSTFTVFDEIDYYISLNQTESAIKLLRKIDKKSNPINVQLGIYKRYVILGESKRADKLIKKCYKYHSNNLQIVAIYSHKLLKDGKIKEALKVARKLSGTEYASLYSEALLKKYQMNENNETIDYFSKDYLNLFYDAYLGTKENYWLRNCAVINLLTGKSDSALIYAPENFSNSVDAFFWGLVFYDNKKFVEALENFQKAKEFVEFELNDTFNSKIKNELTSVYMQTRGLISDCYVNLSEQKLAEDERVDFLGYMTSLIGENTESVQTESVNNDLYDEVLCVIYLNRALYAMSNSNYNVAFELAKFCADQWPDYVPGLICYGNFALESKNFVLTDPMSIELRKLGIKSMDMKLLDEIPVITVEDAIFRMNQSYERFKNYELYVAILELEDKTTEYSEKAALAKVYQIIERNTLDVKSYPPEIVNYAVSRFIKLGYPQEAEKFFHKYLAKQYSFNMDSLFFDECFRNIHQMKIWEIEYIAWFALYQKKADLAKNLYEYIVYNEYLKSQKQVLEISAVVSDEAVMNLAMIYSSLNQKDKALKLYGHIANLCKSIKLKAEAFYRIGAIYLEQDKNEDALKALKYSLYLNPEHTKARLLVQ